MVENESGVPMESGESKQQLTRMMVHHAAATQEQTDLIDLAIDRGYEWPADRETELLALDYNAMVDWLVEHYPEEFELSGPDALPV